MCSRRRNGRKTRQQKDQNHAPYVNRTLKGILENVGNDGKVMNVSGGTAVMKDIEGYRGITKKWIQGWGQGLTLAFLSAVLGCEGS